MQLQELRKELFFNKDLLGLVDTLKNVAAAQYHQLEKQKERFDQFMDAFSGFFRVVNLVHVDNPLVRVVSDVLGVVIVTSDSGFMGGLNQGVMRNALQATAGLPREKLSLVVIGDKGANYFGDQGWKFKFFPGIATDKIYEHALAVKDYVVQEVLAGRMGKVMVAYPKALSFSSQTIDVINILPCAEIFQTERKKPAPGTESPAAEGTLGASPPPGAAAIAGGNRLVAGAREVIVESTFSDMVEYLAGVWVTSKLYEVFEDSKLAEFSARAMHLEGSLQKVEKEYKKVQHRVFKAVHEAIDKGMRECFSAKMIKEKKKTKKKVAARRRDIDAAAA